MVRHTARIWLAGLLTASGPAACGDGGDGGDGTAGIETDGSSNATNPTGVDGGDTEAPGDPTEGPPPEVEDEGDFRVPRASGKYVYSASETTDSVAVIDTATLAIDVVGVGQGPTVLVPIPGQPGDAGSVVVLDRGSDDVAVLRTSEAGVTGVELFPVTPGANNLAVAPGGRHVLVYHDVDGPEQLGPGSDQELTVLDTAAGTTHAMTVGAHPREVVFSTDDTTAWVITAAGVNVITFADLGAVGKPPLLPVVDDAGIDPATLEVQVVASDGIALARVDGEAWVAVTDLADGARTRVDLPGVPTDLDLAPAGGFAVLTIPDVAGSRFLELPLPLAQGGAFVEHAVDGEYVGQSAVAASGDALVLFTTVDPRRAHAPLHAPPPEPAFASETDTDTSTGGTTDTTDTDTDATGAPADPLDFDPRQRITLARRDGEGWALVTLFVEVPVTSVGVAPDSRSALLVHARSGDSATAWSYSLLDLVPAFPLLKRQTTQAEPGPVLFTPDGARAAVLLRDDEAMVRKVDLVDLGNFIVEPLPLGSPPEGAGHVDATDKVFVSQAHPTGRITFIGPDGAVQTVTGFVLNDSVKD
jgi:YVTN family beta-propeller protein